MSVLANCFKNLWALIIEAWNYEPSVEDQEALWRAELQLLYDRVYYLEGLLAEANQKRAYEVAKQLIEDLRKKRGTLFTDAERQFLKTFTPREKCKHLKGGSMRKLGPDGRWIWDKYSGPSFGAHKDYAIRDHTFSDNSRVIRCTICGQKWTKDSPDWKEALRMSSESSSTPSTSERSADVLWGTK